MVLLAPERLGASIGEFTRHMTLIFSTKTYMFSNEEDINCCGDAPVITAQLSMCLH